MFSAYTDDAVFNINELKPSFPNVVFFCYAEEKNTFGKKNFCHVYISRILKQSNISNFDA